MYTLTHAPQPRGIGTYLKLIFVATAPQLRGRGAGRALLARVTADADAAGLPLYLEASDTGVRRLYESFGFEALEELPVRGPGPRGELRIPLMLRQPRGSPAGP